MFGLGGVLFKREDYKKFDPAFRALKVRHLGADVPMHEYDLNRRTDPPFDALQDQAKWDAFREDLASLFKAQSFKIIVVAIHKPDMQTAYELPFPTYHYSLENIVERVAMESKNFGPTWRVIAEDRAKGLNDDLNREMSRLQWSGCGKGIGGPRSNVNAEEVRRKFEPSIIFRKKIDNDSGLQAADLAVGPIVRLIYGLDRPGGRKLTDIVAPKLATARDGTILGFGIKCFPAVPSNCPLK